MKIRTFQALTMQDAIRAIKEELGSDAVILSSKRIRKGGSLFGLFGRSMVEVAAAIELDRRDPERGAKDRRLGTPRTSTQGELSSEAPSDFPQALESSLAKPAPAKADRQRRRGERSGLSEPVPNRRLRDEAAGPSEERRTVQPARVRTHVEPLENRNRPPTEWERIKQELGDIRNLLERSGGHDRPIWLQALPPKLASWHQRLIRSGLEPGTVQKLLMDAQAQRPEVPIRTDAEARSALRDVFSRHVLAGGPLLSSGDEKKAVLFIGPTGVGKTTTIAKLAAHYRLQERRRVSLVTLDTYRVAAVEQLRLYASVIGVTMDVALTKEEALDCLRRRSHADLILIDTAGHSPLDAEGVEEVRRLTAGGHPFEVHVVLSATTRDGDVMESLARYASIPINRLLFTKLDETTARGGIFELMRRTGLPLSYFSTGQRVPDDLEVASPEGFADLVLEHARLPAGEHQRGPMGKSVSRPVFAPEADDGEDHLDIQQEHHHNGVREKEILND